MLYNIAKWILIMILRAAFCSLLLTLFAGRIMAFEATSLLQTLRCDQYHAPPSKEIDTAQVLFYQLMSTGISNALIKQWQSLDFTLRQLDKSNIWILHESQNRRHGRGFFLFKNNHSGSFVLQAPHSYKDLATGELALLWFKTDQFYAGAWNSVPRRYQLAGELINADMAALPASYFTAFTHAVTKISPIHPVIQLHGFSNAKRTTRMGKHANMILSSGSLKPRPWLLQFQRCLADKLERVWLYPTQVTELGGRRNQIGKIVRRYRNAEFIHWEVSATMRKQLLNDADLRTTIGQCIRF